MARRNATSTNTSDDSNSISAGQGVSQEIEINTISTDSTSSETISDNGSQGVSIDTTREDSESNSSTAPSNTSKSESVDITITNERTVSTSSEGGLTNGQSNSVDIEIDTLTTNTTESTTILENASQRIVNDISRSETETSTATSGNSFDIDQGTSINNNTSSSRTSENQAFAQDSQTLSIEDGQLFISRGNSVPLPDNGDLTYTHDQGMPSAIWNVVHNLGKSPSVTIVDSTGEIVDGKVVFVDTNEINIEFNAAFSGQAYLN